MNDDLLNTAAAARELVETLEKEVQTIAAYPEQTSTEVIKEVIKYVDREVVKEVFIKEDASKIDDTNLERDEQGHFKVFESVSSAESPDEEDKLSADFLARTKVAQI